MARKKKYDYYKFELNIDGGVERNRFFIYRHPLERTRPYFLNTLEHINRIAAAAAESEARFALVIAPRFHHWNPKECPENWEEDAYSLNEPYQHEYFTFFEERGSQLTYDVFNLLPAFQKTREFPLVFENDPHWNEAGHTFVAKLLADYLIEKQLIR